MNFRWAFLSVVAAIYCSVSSFPAHAATRYYLIQSDYAWSMYATEDTASYGGTLHQVPRPPVPPGRFKDPLGMTVLLKVDDANLPGRKARVTFWFKHLHYRSSTHEWAVDDFSDREALRQVSRQFLSQRRTFDSTPRLAAYEEESLASLMLLMHGRSYLVDFDVPPDTPDLLVYQADAMIDEAMSTDPTPAVNQREGVYWLDSPAQASEITQRAMQSGVMRVERIRHLLWHHIKLLAFFCENHQYAYFNPRLLVEDAPTITVPEQVVPAAGQPPQPNEPVQTVLVRRKASLSSNSPAFAFPSLYRWASLTPDDFARAIGESQWRRTAASPATVTPPTSLDSRAAAYAKRLEQVRATLADNRPTTTLDVRHRMGARYIDTLVSIHKMARWRGDETTIVGDGLDHGWEARFPVDQPVTITHRDGTTEHQYASEHGLWLAILDNARYKVDDRTQAADRYRIARRQLHIVTTAHDVPVYVPALISDQSTARLAVLSVDAATKIEGRQLSPRDAEKLLEEWLKPGALSPAAGREAGDAVDLDDHPARDIDPLQ